MARILVIDDDHTVLDLVKDILTKYAKTMFDSSWDLTVHATTDPVAALEIIKDHNYELIITDVLMARCSGWELIRKLRDKFPEFSTPIVVMSAVQGIDLEYEALRHGASAWFHKPFSPKEFAQKVFGLIQTR